MACRFADHKEPVIALLTCVCTVRVEIMKIVRAMPLISYTLNMDIKAVITTMNRMQTGPDNDKARLLQFIEAGVLDPVRFKAVLARHGLVDAWQRFERQFFSVAL